LNTSSSIVAYYRSIWKPPGTRAGITNRDVRAVFAAFTSQG
jgi:hypothetical protein